MYCARVNRFFKYAMLSNLRNEMAKVYGEKKGRNYSVTVYYTITFYPQFSNKSRFFF